MILSCLALFAELFYCFQSTVRDLFSVDENEEAFEEMVTANKRQEEQPAKKNQKSQNAFEEVEMNSFNKMFNYQKLTQTNSTVTIYLLRKKFPVFLLPALFLMLT